MAIFQEGVLGYWHKLKLQTKIPINMEDLIPLFLASCVIFLVLALLGGKTGMCRQRMTIPCAESARILAS